MYSLLTFMPRVSRCATASQIFAYKKSDLAEVVAKCAIDSFILLLTPATMNTRTWLARIFAPGSYNIINIVCYTLNYN